jgi:hypothetical protein
MKKIIHLLSFVITGTFLGCSTVTHYNPATGKYETKFVSGTFGMFADVVERDIQGELRGDKIEVSWRDHWIDWCQTLYYDRNLGDSYVQYIIDKRRAAGLPEITEINNRQFQSEWQIFTDKVNFQIGRESQGLPPPHSIRREASAWSEYWKIIEERALRNSAVSTKGVEYINAHRKQAGLPPLN